MKEAISLQAFKERTGLTINENTVGVESIVSLREIVVIEKIEVMSIEYLNRLLRSATLEGQPTVHPYKSASFELVRIDPHILAVGQTFAERGKYQKLVETFNNMFEKFSTNNGFVKLTPLIVIGINSDGKRVAAHYLPPIIEIHNAKHCLIDGVHRNFLTMAVGTTITSIVIQGAITPPCSFGSWKNIIVVDEKPPREKRFLDLNTAYFRNLGWSGIDG